MAKRISILTSSLSDSPYFTPDNTAVSHYVEITSSGYSFTFYNEAGHSTFLPGDALVLISFGFILPENFVLASGAGPTPFYLGPSISPGYFRELSDADGYTLAPAENYENVVNLFLDPVLNGLTASSYALMGDIGPAKGFHPRVSMVGSPSALNGVKQYATPFIKVAHTLPMSV